MGTGNEAHTRGRVSWIILPLLCRRQWNMSEGGDAAPEPLAGAMPALSFAFP